MAAGTDEARVSWWGFNPADSTAFLQQAINSKVPKLIVDKMPSPWYTNKLTAVSNQEIIFEEGVELVALKGQFHGLTDALIRISRQENVTLRGLAAPPPHTRLTTTPRLQNRSGGTASAFEFAQGQHHQLSIVDTGGDGIYLGIPNAASPH